MFYAATMLLEVSDGWQFAGIGAGIATAVAIIIGGGLAFVSRWWASRFDVSVKREDGSDYIHVIVRPHADDQYQVIVSYRPTGAREKDKEATFPWTLDWRENKTGQPVVNGLAGAPLKFDLARDIDTDGLLFHSLHEQGGTRFHFANPSQYAADKFVTVLVEVRSVRFHRSAYQRVTIYPPGAPGQPPTVESVRLGLRERLARSLTRDDGEG